MFNKLLFLTCSSDIILLLIMQLLDMVEQNELNRPLLTLLDENIVTAQKDGQVRDFLKI